MAANEVLLEAIKTRIENYVDNMGREGDGGVKPMPYTLFLSGTIGARAGAAADGVLVGALTPQAVGSFQMLDADGPTWVDDTTDINSAGAADVLLMPATEASGAEGTGDTANFGHLTKRFSGIKITLSTAGTVGVVVWEYWNGTAWTLLSTAHNLLDSSVEYTAGTSTYLVTWAVPADWALKTLNSISAYYVRSRITTVFTVNPVATRAWLLTVNDGVGVSSPVNGEIKSVDFSALTVSGAADSIFQFINLSTGKVASVSFAQAVAAQAGATIVGGLPVSQGDKLVVQQISSHATPAADVLAILQIN